MKFLDLELQHNKLSSQIESSVIKVMRSGQYILGSNNAALEKELSDYVGRKYVATCSSGTDALLISLMSYGIGRGDIVFTTTFSFIATAEVIVRLGATPVFVDIDPETLNIDKNQLSEILCCMDNGSYSHKSLRNLSIEELSVLNKRVLLTVSIFGNPYDYEEIDSIRKKYDLILVEDEAQGFGGSRNNYKSCSFGDISCTSFFPSKPLGCYGDGGAIFTDDEEVFDKIKSIRVHGQGSDRYSNIRIGITGRLDEIQAAVLLVKLKCIDEEIQVRNEVADFYNGIIDKLSIRRQFVSNENISSWAQYSLIFDKEVDRDDFSKSLDSKKIPSVVYYKIPLHLQKSLAFLGYLPGDFPVSESISRKILSIPLGSHLRTEDLNKIERELLNI